MDFLYDYQQKKGREQECCLLWNGLGGYSSVTGEFGAPRADQGILVAAVKAPNERISLVHRLREQLLSGEKSWWLSTQAFADGTEEEDGWRQQTAFCWERGPRWQYGAGGVKLLRQCAMGWERNTVAVLYRVENPTRETCTLEITPFFKFAPKEAALEAPKLLKMTDNRVCCDGYTLHIQTDGKLECLPESWQVLAYPEDTKDGRPEKGLAGTCCRVMLTVGPGRTESFQLVFSMEQEETSGWELLQEQARRFEKLENAGGFTDPVARTLAVSADAFIARRDSTKAKTILAGYPLFSDWGRDTMIALPGCTLATGRYEDAKSILRTFLQYEKDGLVPNLFPEGGQEPMYNTVDAALLLIDCLWQYWQATEDPEFVREAWPVLERIVAAYQKGTHYAIGMDEDGLIHAGEGLAQVTWMDVCIQGVLPTPRHGKPVEINAYWYNALKIMETLSPLVDADGSGYGALAEKVKRSFREQFYMEDKGYLRDVLSGTDADEQIRCNQIWALAMPFTMLEREQERKVLQTVKNHLLTDCGLRTLSPEDPQYRGFYGGSQFDRDMAYHQGTVWVFPMGAYYRAYLRLYPREVRQVKEQLQRLVPMLRQGCAGQLPEIYSGDDPYEGKGCFAQAWSVGEMLRVFDILRKMEGKEAQL